MSIPSNNAPGTPNSSGTPSNQPARQPTADDVLDLLSREDEPTPPADKVREPADRTREPKPKEDDDDIRLHEEDDDERLRLEEDDEDKDKDKDKNKDKDKGRQQQEDLELDAPPKKQQLLAKYPDIFKTFPWFEKMIYRDRQYTELFGSFDDAKDVAEQAQMLQRFEGDLVNGNTETILKQVKDNDPKAWDKVVDNYLGALAKVDKEAYVEVCSNIGKHIISDLVKEARSVAGTNKDQSELLHNTALILNQYLFGSSNYTPPKPRVAQQSNEEEERLNREKSDFTRQRYESSRDELQGRVDNTLKATISDYIDRNNEMSPFVKKHAISEAMKLLHGTIGNDRAFRRDLDRLWESAFGDNFSQNSLGRIKSAYLGRAKQLLKPIIAKARAEALKDNVPVNRQEQDQDEEQDRPSRRGPIVPGRPRQSGGKNERKPGESVMEFFSRD